MGRLIFTLLLLQGALSWAGRPVYQTLNRSDLVDRSPLVFSGWPSRDPAISACSHELGRWWVHKVYKGDKSLQGKVIALAPSGYQIWANAKDKMIPSYQAFRYKTGQFDTSSGTSFLFAIPQKDGCFELAAQGAQEDRNQEPEMDALFSDAKDCTMTMRGFEFRASKMPVECQKDSDCKLIYANPNSCERPFVWNVKAEALMDFDFQRLQARARTACMDRWSHQPACEPITFPFHCQNQKCEEISPVATAKGKTIWKKATMESSCAPMDASSVMIRLTNGKSDYPVLTLNWWGPPRPSSAGGVFEIQGKSGDMAEGFQAAYCPSKGHCPLMKGFKAKLTWPKDGKEGTFDFSFTTDEGESDSGTIPVQLLTTQQPVICG